MFPKEEIILLLSAESQVDLHWTKVGLGASRQWNRGKRCLGTFRDK